MPCCLSVADSLIHLYQLHSASNVFTCYWRRKSQITHLAYNRHVYFHYTLDNEEENIGRNIFVFSSLCTSLSQTWVKCHSLPVSTLNFIGIKITPWRKSEWGFIDILITKNNNNVCRLFTLSKPELTITQITATALKNRHVQLEAKEVSIISNPVEIICLYSKQFQCWKMW
jgi:hypothetical protein